MREVAAGVEDRGARGGGDVMAFQVWGGRRVAGAVGGEDAGAQGFEGGEARDGEGLQAREGLPGERVKAFVEDEDCVLGRRGDGAGGGVVGAQGVEGSDGDLGRLIR